MCSCFVFVSAYWAQIFFIFIVVFLIIKLKKRMISIFISAIFSGTFCRWFTSFFRYSNGIWKSTTWIENEWTKTPRNKGKSAKTKSKTVLYNTIDLNNPIHCILWLNWIGSEYSTQLFSFIRQSLDEEWKYVHPTLFGFDFFHLFSMNFNLSLYSYFLLLFCECGLLFSFYFNAKRVNISQHTLIRSHTHTQHA